MISQHKQVGRNPVAREQTGDGIRQVRIAQVPHGQVDGHASSSPLSSQLPALLYRCFYNPVGQGGNETGLLGERYKLVGRNKAMRGVLPAHQGFDARDQARWQLGFRLVV